MSIWGKIGKGLLAGAGVAAAPFTGGASLATIIPAIAGAAGQVATGIGGRRQEGRAIEASANQQQDLLKLQAARLMEDALLNRAGLDLQRRQFALNAPGQRAGNSVRGDILANARDASVSGPIARTGGQMPTIAGGLRPSLLSGNTRQLGSQMSRQALLSQMQGDRYDPLPAPAIPGVTPLPQAGKLDTALNVIGGVGNLVGVLGQSGLFGDRDQDDDEHGLFGKDGPLAQARKPIPLLPIGNPGIPTFGGWA